MKCVFCKQPAGFFESYHDECYNNVMATLKKLEGVINSYNKNHIDAKKAKATLLDLASSNRMYQNYLESKIVDMQAIRTNETAVYDVERRTESCTNGKLKWYVLCSLTTRLERSDS